MVRNLAAFFGGLFLSVVVLAYAARDGSHGSEYDKAACAGPPLKSVAERVTARENGYVIHQRYGCIDKVSFDRVNLANAERQRARAQAFKLTADAANLSKQTLAQARHGFTTKISVRAASLRTLPNPPNNLFVRSDYKTESDRVLPAFVTPNPVDGQKHPAIIWLAGNEPNSLGEFWISNPESDDSAAKAFRDAGVVVMFVTLRGGNGDARGKEFFLGEVDDVLAAADHLASLGYVNAERIFLGGHGGGATLALLTAETSSRFAGVFAFGPMAEVDHYSSIVVPVDFNQYSAQERRLRSPLYWLQGIESPTYMVEAKGMPGNRRDIDTLCEKANNSRVHCILAEGENRFSVLSKVSTVIAARLAISDSRDFSIRADEF